MFFELLFAIILSALAGAAFVCVVAGYLVLNGDIRIETTVRHEEKKKRKAERKAERKQLMDELKKAEEKETKKTKESKK